MTRGYFLTGKGKEYYGEQFQDLNRRIDAFLRRIFGDFHWESPRNWVGKAKQGMWSVKSARIDSAYIIPAYLFALLLLFWMYVNTPYSSQALFYLLGLLLVAIVATGNWNNPKVFAEFIASGDEIHKLKDYTEMGLILAISFSIFYLVVGGTLSKQVVMEPQQITLIDGALTALVGIFIVGYTETAFFGSFFTPSFARQFGIIPSILLVSLAAGFFHLTVLKGSVFGVIMSTIFAFLYILLLFSQMSKFPAAVAHISFNAFAYLFLFLGITTLTSTQLIAAVILGAISIIILRKI